MRLLILVLLLSGCANKPIPPANMDIDASELSISCDKPSLMPEQGLDQEGILVFSLNEAQKLQLCGTRYNALVKVLCSLANCKGLQ